MSGSATSGPPSGRPPDPAPGTTASPGQATPWTAWPVGARVVVRRRLPEGGYSDVLGDLLATGPGGVRVRTRRGEVWVDAADIALGKLVPPAPPRRG